MHNRLHERRTESTNTIERSSVRKDTARIKSGIYIGTLNIMDGRGSRLQLAYRQMQLHDLDIVILTEAKLNGNHSINAFGYDIMATKTIKKNQGGVAIISRKSRDWHLEGGERFGPNVIKTTLVHKGLRIRIIGAYIPPSEEDLQTTRYIDQALTNENPDKCILLGDFNLDYHNPRNNRTEKITESLRTYEWRDLSQQFRKSRWKPYSWTWRKHREGRFIQSICDYIFTGKITMMDEL